MPWNYRLTKRYYPKYETYAFGFREVYYSHDSGDIISYSKDICSPYVDLSADDVGEDLSSDIDLLAKQLIRDELKRLLDALDKDILDLEKVDERFDENC